MVDVTDPTAPHGVDSFMPFCAFFEAHRECPSGQLLHANPTGQLPDANLTSRSTKTGTLKNQLVVGGKEPRHSKFLPAQVAKEPFNLARLVGMRGAEGSSTRGAKRSSNARSKRKYCTRTESGRPYKRSDVVNLAIARTGSESLRDVLVDNDHEM